MKPWIVINAQNKVIGRYATDVEANTAHSEKVAMNLVNIQYAPRGKRTKKEFPYV